MDAPAVVGVMFRNAMKRTDNEGTYYAFRVEVTARTASASYALVHLRYSQLRTLCDSLAARHPGPAQRLPAFPAKTWMAPSEADWKLRCVALTGYFAAVFADPVLAADAEVQRMFARNDEAEPWTPPATDLSEADEEARYRYVDLPTGVRIGYIEAGDATKPLVLFVHGFPETLWTWAAVMDVVAKEGFYCVSMATRGYYPSSLVPVKPDEADWQRYGKHLLARDILHVIAGLKKTQAAVVGHDWGATSAWAAAVLDQQDGSGLVGRIVVESVPPPKAIALRPSLVFKARHFLYFNTPLLDVAAGTRASNYVYLDQLVERWSPTWAFDARILSMVKRHFNKEGRLEAAIAYHKTVSTPKEAAAVYDALNTTDVRCPVLFIGGEDDSGGGDQMAEFFKQSALQCASSCEVVIVRQAGHFVHVEKQQAFLHKFLPFLKQTVWPDGKQTKIKYIQQQSAADAAAEERK